MYCWWMLLNMFLRNKNASSYSTNYISTSNLNVNLYYASDGMLSKIEDMMSCAIHKLPPKFHL
ncbi:hypothetical protein Syun_025388 [Stephania yunnanensis]|uniref:Uncharacterized protein n=1 Tax=Stephania yunnanensis TaxID=152371 RepID=A0AAP0EX50_9MAGN